jgi:hypothetical protein
MKEDNNIVKIYSGDEASVLHLKARLEQAGITSLSKNDLPDAWFGTVPPALNLYIQESDMKEAEPIIREFIKS